MLSTHALLRRALRQLGSLASFALLALAQLATGLPRTAAAAADGNSGSQVANLATQYVGAKYAWGGASPAGFDCTGFVMWVYSQFGVSLPHTEAGQLAAGQPVSADDLQPGDVVVFANTYRPGLSHAGIYLGNGRFIHAVDESHGVLVSNMWDSYWGPRFFAASRELA